MFVIRQDNADIAIVETLHHIRRHHNGCYVHADKASAQGLVVNGAPYNLLGAPPLDETLATVCAVEVDGGEYLVSHQAILDMVITTMLEG
jgi:hypothetical protein